MSTDYVLPSRKEPERNAVEPSDEELFKSFQEGNQRAFETIFQRYRGPIFDYLIRLIRDQAIAEEIFQEAFLHLFRRTSQFDSSRTFRPWFFRVAHNRAMDFFRKNPERGNLEKLQEEFPQSAPSPEYLALKAESARDLDQMLHLLSEEHRSVLLLKFKEDLTYEEIAEVIDCPVGTAKSRMHHAIKNLQDLMKKER